MKNKKHLLALILITMFCSVLYAGQTGVFDRLRVGDTTIDSSGVQSKTNLLLNTPSGDLDVTSSNVDIDVTTSFNVNVGGSEAFDVMESTTPTGGFGNVGLGGPASTADTQPLTVIRNINDLSAVLTSNTSTGTSALAGYSAQVATGPGGVGLTNVLQAPTNYSLIPDWQGFGILRNFRGSGLKLIARDFDASANDSIDFLVGGQDDSFMISSIDGSGVSIFDGLDLSFFDADSSNFVSLKSPAIVGTDVVLTLPDNDGNAGEFLQTDGTGVLSWAAAGGGGANTTLSNLSSPTAVNQDLSPGVDDTYFLGSSSFHWTGLYTPYITNQLLASMIIESNAGIFIDPDANSSGAEPLIVEGDIQLHSVGAVNSEVRFREDVANGTNYVALAGPDSITSNVVWKLPNVDGTSGQALSTNGTGDLSWSSFANQALSNLTSPTSFNQSLIPDGTTRDIGTSAANIKDIYLREMIFYDYNNPTDEIGYILALAGGIEITAFEGAGGQNSLVLESDVDAPVVIRTAPGGGSNSGDIELTPGTSGATRGSIKADARLALVPGAQFSITADNQAVTVTHSVHNIISDSVTATDRTFTISNGINSGQVLTLIFTDATDSAELQDTGNVRLNGTWTPDVDDTLTLIWFGSAWYETSRSGN